MEYTYNLLQICNAQVEYCMKQRSLHIHGRGEAMKSIVVELDPGDERGTISEKCTLIASMQKKFTMFKVIRWTQSQINNMERGDHDCIQPMYLVICYCLEIFFRLQKPAQSVGKESKL